MSGDAGDRMARLFHLVVPEALEAARGAPSWRPASLETEGFVHLSFAGQLAGTLETHFAPARRLLLVEVDAAAVADALRVEVSRGSEAFPHVYRALAWSELLRWWMLGRAGDGRWLVPSLGADPALDEPAGAREP